MLKVEPVVTFERYYTDDVFKYIGVPLDEIGYNQPAGVKYPTENPWG